MLFRNITGLGGVDPDAAAVVEQRDANRRAGLTALARRLADRDLVAPGVPLEQVAEGLWLLTSYPVFDHLHRRSGFDVERTARLLTRFADALLRDDRNESVANRGHPPAHGNGGRHGA